MRFYAAAQLGPSQSLTPEGFLACRDTPIARIGTMAYVGDELPGLNAGPDGMIQVSRGEGDLFADDAIASFEGKPVVIGHTWVTPKNWKSLAVGTMQNVRRGTGAEQDLLLADLLITDEYAISRVRGDLRELSLGYDSSYSQDAPGVARQHTIIGNHVALVPAGRCGPRCAIGDEEPSMSVFARIRRLIKTGDEEAALKELDKAEKAEAKTEDEDPDEDKGEKEDREKTSDTLAKVLARLDALEKPPVTKTEDASPAASVEAWKDMVSLAEVMVPGIALPSYEDAPIKTADAMCSCQRRALESAYATKPGKAAIDASLHGAKPTFDSMSRDAVAMLFGATAAILGQGNNAGGLRLLVGDADPNRPDFSHRTPAGLQKIHDNFWAAKTPATARR